MPFFPDLFNLYSEAILRKLETLTGFIIDGDHIKNIRYADDTVLNSDTEQKDLLDKESEKKRLIINCMKTESMVAVKARWLRCDLRTGDISIKQVQNFKYQGSLLTET